ncbi:MULTISPECIES: OmpA family protein [Novacetimonas]|uniref:OmpA family protein n=1 Tax=Novacetimonas TaxID=2919364 RepID=UPI00094F6D99|nr:OmpA family protein [Novacetimonas hansenii]PYD73086.1 hypothetical protein CFR74_06220 [Novacetimonas hansenii]
MGNPAPAPSSDAVFFVRRGIRRGEPGTGARLACAIATLALLGGCATGHRDTVDTLTDWYHSHQGGVIGQQRPPPPGAHDPYPHVGLGPREAPVLPSQDLRDDITTNLSEQRALIHREDATMGPIPSVADVPPPPTTTAAGTQSASFAAASSAPSPTTARPAHQAGGDDTIAMPEVSTALPGEAQILPTTLPALAKAPPEPVTIAGMGTIGTNEGVSRRLPDYQLDDDLGRPVRFDPGSDQMQHGQDRTLSDLAKARGDGTIVINGYGDATTASAQGQAQAMSLAILRSRTLARALAAHGVPESAIRLHASAFGTGARVGIVR